MEEDLSVYNPEGSMMRKAQQRMLQIMVEVDKIFRRHGIPYFLESGTLIGAMRHGGFIPWDDDLDIGVMRSDLPRIKKVLQEELPDDLLYQDASTEPNYHMAFPKVRDKYSIFDDPYSKRFKERGIYIDLIVWEEVNCLPLKQKLDFVYIRCLRGMHHYSDSIIEQILGYVCYPPTYLMVVLCRWWSKLFPAKQLAHTYGFVSPYRIPEDIIFPLSEIQFEGHSFKAPHDADKCLRIVFGDYMQIPPKDKRVTHLAEITFLDK